MTSLREELIKILEEEIQLLINLYKIVSHERDAIVSLNSQELEKILMEKQEILAKIGLWETEREKLFEKHEIKGMSLKMIINYLGKNSHKSDLKRLEELYEKMKTLLESIAEIQKINEQLIDRSMIHIGTALKFLETFGITARQSIQKEA